MLGKIFLTIAAISAVIVIIIGFTYAKKILSLMKIDKAEQERFLELCKEYGGYCDCEILMNAAPKLLGEETPW